LALPWLVVAKERKRTQPIMIPFHASSLAAATSSSLFSAGSLVEVLFTFDVACPL